MQVVRKVVTQIHISYFPGQASIPAPSRHSESPLSSKPSYKIWFFTLRTSVLKMAAIRFSQTSILTAETVTATVLRHVTLCSLVKLGRSLRGTLLNVCENTRRNIAKRSSVRRVTRWDFRIALSSYFHSGQSEGTALFLGGYSSKDYPDAVQRCYVGEYRLQNGWGLCCVCVTFIS